MQTTFELYFFQNRQWTLDSIFNDYPQAIYHSELLLDSRHLDGVRVIREDIDDETDEIFSTVVLEKNKNDVGSQQLGKPANKRSKISPTSRKNAAGSTSGRRRKKKHKDTFGRYFLRVTLIVFSCWALFVALSSYIISL